MEISASEYSAFDATGLAELIAAGEVSREGVEEAARTAIAAVNPHVNALAMPLFDESLAHDASGPFGGVPMLLKDEGPFAAGVAYTNGSRYYEGVVADRDEELMKRFRRAGLAVLGSTTTPEMCLSFATESRRKGVTRNPWDLQRGVGGSSGGSGALLAAGAVPITHGSDAAGSIRVPASFCGTVGLKPSRGRTPADVDPMLGLAYSFALTRTIRDTARLLDATSGPDPVAKYVVPRPTQSYADLIAQHPGRLRIAVAPASWAGVPIDADASAAVERTARQLEELGHSVEYATPTVSNEDLVTALATLMGLYYASVFRDAPRRPTPELVEGMTWTGWLETKSTTLLQVSRGIDSFDTIVRSLAGFFGDYDVLVTPTTGMDPIPHGTLNYDNTTDTVETWAESVVKVGQFTSPFNVGGQPAISLPLAESAAGLPIGVQIVGANGRDDLVLQVAAQLEVAMPWKDRRPRIHASTLASHGVAETASHREGPEQ